jgi:proteasome lid subunit RPN8/RPN11
LETGLSIAPEALAEIVAHARDALPFEACGYLGAREDVVVRVVRMTNAAASPTRFSLVPEEQFAVLRALRAEGLTLRGVYHSHPDGPARLSDADLRGATDPALLYVVASLAGDSPEVRAFRADGAAAEVRIAPVGEGDQTMA